MGSTTIKIGESKVFVNEFGQLCEAVNMPNYILRNHKGEIIIIEHNVITFEKVTGLRGRLGSIQFNLHQ